MKPIIFLIIMILILGCSSSSIKTINCTSYNYDKCPKECVICPPCEVCSSISCQTEEFCNSIGFDRKWEEQVKARR